jgi:3-hydroxyisobutyrate dehydrogenase-like beta-hydroxyacid dehydrogenase
MAPRIGFVGLGVMGSRMARHFLAAGHPLAVWNRTSDRAAELVRAGAALAATPAEVAADADFVITCVTDAGALRAIAGGDERGGGGLLARPRAGLVWIETSTIGAPASRELAERAASRGVAYLEAPVTGSRRGAEEATLLAMTGGPEALHAACEPVLRVFAREVIHVGPVGSAAVMKLIGNTLIAFMLEGLAETAVLGARAGLALPAILEVVSASMFASPFFAFKGEAMARRAFDEVLFSIELLAKDLALVADEAAARGVAMPGLEAIRRVTEAARSLGHGAEDIAAQLRAIEALAK